MAQNNPSDLLDDLSDIDEESLYQICENKKVNGASNSELREYLKENGLGDDQIKEWVRQIDSDYLAGNIQKAPTIASVTVSSVFATVLIFIGIGVILLQIMLGIISLWLIIVGISAIVAGIGMVSRGRIQKSKFRDHKMRSRFHDTTRKKKI